MGFFDYFKGESEAVKAIRARCEEEVKAQKAAEASQAPVAAAPPPGPGMSDSVGGRRKTRRSKKSKKSKRSRTGRKSSHP